MTRWIHSRLDACDDAFSAIEKQTCQMLSPSRAIHVATSAVELVAGTVWAARSKAECSTSCSTRIRLQALCHRSWETSASCRMSRWTTRHG